MSLIMTVKARGLPERLFAFVLGAATLGIFLPYSVPGREDLDRFSKYGLASECVRVGCRQLGAHLAFSVFAFLYGCGFIVAFPGPPVWLTFAAVALALWFGAGSWIFYRDLRALRRLKREATVMDVHGQ